MSAIVKTALVAPSTLKLNKMLTLFNYHDIYGCWSDMDTYTILVQFLKIWDRIRVMVFIATFNSISVIL